MQYFAIGENNGGAGERRLGPFDTAEEAQAAGEKETRESNGGFIYRGVVDEANNQVFTAGDKTALNAKISNSVRTTCPVVANAIAANRRIARNAYCEAGDYIETRDGAQDTVKRVVGDKVYLKSGDIISMTDVKTVLNARRVARNAMTVEEQREYQRTKLPKIEAEVNAYVKEADSIYNQVMAALKKADGIASIVSALSKKAEKLVKSDRYNPVLGVFEFDETKAKALYAKMDAAYRKIVECRDKASEIGNGLVNSFRTY